MLILLLAVSLNVVAGIYQVDKDHSKFGFNVDHLVISSVDGRFTDFEGSFDYTPETRSLKNIDIKVKTSSINTDNVERDNHLKGADFFDVAKYPEITFKSQSVNLNKKGKATLTGTLNMHGKSLPVKFEILISGPVKNPWGASVLAFNATSAIKRKDFDLNWNKTLEAGGVLVGEKVKIEIKGEAKLKN